MRTHARRTWYLIAGLAAVGILVSSVSLYHHYDRSQSSFCDFGGSFNCDIVNRSLYSVVLGIPVALVGIVGYAGVLTLATLFKDRSGSERLLLVASLAGLAFALRLTYIEGFVLAAWCALCLGSLAIISVITLLSASLLMRRAQ